MSELRQRQAATAKDNEKTKSQRRPHAQANPDEDQGISVLDVIRILATFIIVTLGVSYYISNGESVLFGYKPWFTRWPVVKQYMVSNTAN